jgi:hypothetical protein
VMEPIDGPIQHLLSEEVPSLLQVVTGDISTPPRATLHGVVARLLEIDGLSE